MQIRNQEYGSSSEENRCNFGKLSSLLVFQEFSAFNESSMFYESHLKERLNLGPLLDLLLGHLLGDLPWVPVNTSNQGMAGWNKIFYKK